ncbi:hypothetical protein GPECTOR_7g1336 [Gonium pectorale]|uniref:Electron transfer flavoprotein alpha/beta-subunit N-terminal domain-containing protein n=1 Tax=Gonium pectorale TaxID=33097 RepID=A0A150GUR8_GONPE|nr:hypothetical protein GPECTOR_7g1336 [Gonium pectorale]|eukprot:KXZ53438.1 hypothetical protein GPECTOR_7g1336 [Gonium pectorale]
MKVLVAVKRVIDYAVPVRVKADKSGVEALLPKMSMNPFCEIALEVLSLPLPAVITADLRLNTPRFVTLPAMMRAKKRPIEAVPADSLGLGPGELEPQLAVLRVEEPPARRAGSRVGSVGELVRRLREEARVL